jgi:hypothetical protein
MKAKEQSALLGEAMNTGHDPTHIPPWLIKATISNHPLCQALSSLFVLLYCEIISGKQSTLLNHQPLINYLIV